MGLVDDPPAMERRFLHGCHDEATVGRHRDVEVATLPFIEIGRGRRVREPQRDAVVMGDRKPIPLGREGEAAHARGGAEAFHLALVVARIGRLSRRPGDRARGTERDGVDPGACRVCKLGD